jgi:hypothetical protein
VGRIDELKNFETDTIARRQESNLDFLECIAVDAEDGCTWVCRSVTQFGAPISCEKMMDDSIHRRAIVPDLLEAKDGAVPLNRCVAIGDADCEVIDDVVVYLGLRGDVNVDFLAELPRVDDGMEDGALRKTRAGGN